MIVTVWNTTQYAEYEADPFCDHNIGEGFRDEPSQSSVRPRRNGAHDSGYSSEPRQDRGRTQQNGAHGSGYRGEPQKNIIDLLKKNILDDSDTLLMFALILILMRENADHKLIFSLLFVMFT